MPKSDTMKFKVIIKEGEDGWYVVEVPSLPGCISQGKTIKEALKNIKEAIELYLEPDEKLLSVGAGQVAEVTV
jgi:predicted RNase H-like HicB family nuclease